MKKNTVICSTAAACITLVILVISGLTGCGRDEPEPVNKYTSGNGMYSVSLPGEWEVQKDDLEIQGAMTLTKEDGTSSILVGLRKGELPGPYGGDVETLEDFQNYAAQTFLNGGGITTELESAEAVELDGMKRCLAQSGTMTQFVGSKRRVYVECAESEQAFYMLMFSTSENSDKKISKIKEALALEEIGS